MECLSPDQKVKAVYWLSMGGGAAGWAYQFLAIVPGDTPASGVLGKDTVGDGLVLMLAGGHNLILT
jgi:hypothetical protein